MQFHEVSKKTIVFMWFSCAVIFAASFSCASVRLPFNQAIKQTKMFVRAYSSGYLQTIQEEAQLLIKAFRYRVFVELGRRHKCPYGTEDHCDDFHFYQEGIKYLDYYIREYPDFVIVLKREMEDYYSIIELVADKDYFSYGSTEIFLQLNVERFVDSIEIYIEFIEKIRFSSK